MKRIYFTVTNDLNYDQRMHRICTSLSQAGFLVTLVGRKLKASRPLQNRVFRQKRLHCIFSSGFLFYAEYNISILFFLLFSKMDVICVIDLDTALPGLIVSKLRGLPRIYDAHEYFSELKEVHSRPAVRKFWLMVEKLVLHCFLNGYTVSEGLQQAFINNYGREYLLIRNLPVLREIPVNEKKEKFLLYQGAVNEGRAFEFLIPAMKNISYPLVVCGDGNFMDKLKELIRKNNVDNKVELKGMLHPEELLHFSARATLGIGLAEREGVNQYFALPNKFFDYIHAGLPQITMRFPEYERINLEYELAVLIDDLAPHQLAVKINEVMTDDIFLNQLTANCLKARQVYCWQNEEAALLSFYRKIFSIG